MASFDELYHKAQLVKQGDLLHITNNVNTFDKIIRVLYIGRHTITVKGDLQFSMSSLQCVTPNRSILFIKDIYFILERRIKDFFVNKGFKHRKIDDITQMQKVFDKNIINITCTKAQNKYKGACRLGISCNDITLFAGEVYDETDLDVIYKCTISKLEL